jgi:predicted secreted protein
VQRGRKVVFVSHCILNQNAKSIGRGKYPGAIRELIELFAEAGVGIVQLPCPQLDFNSGLDRKPKGKSAYDKKDYRKSCKKLSSSLLKQIENYLQKNYTIIGILGVESSPTCGVQQVENGNRSVPGKGIFIEELEVEMQKKNFQVPVIGINLNNMYSSMEKLQSLLKYA